jgi:DNA-binding MarR family transcriptional regulator
MINYNAASMISKIRESVNKMIVIELENNGIEDIASSHGDILSFLYNSDGSSVRKITEKINRTQPTVTVLVDKLELLGYVKRCKSEEDRRVTIVRLTDKGKQLEPIFRKISSQLNEIIYGSLTNDQKEQLEFLLKHILEKF